MSNTNPNTNPNQYTNGFTQGKVVTPSTVAVGTLESLSESLRQAVEDRTRNDAKIAEIKKTISGSMAILQSLDNTVHAIQPEVPVEQLPYTQEEDFLPPRAALSEKPQEGKERRRWRARIDDELREEREQRRQKLQAHVEEIGDLLSMLKGAIWGLVKPVLIFIVLFLLIWIAMGWLNAPKAEGCFTSDRPSSRLQERREVRDYINREYIAKDREARRSLESFDDVADPVISDTPAAEAALPPVPVIERRSFQPFRR